MHAEKIKENSLYPDVENENKSKSYRNHHGGYTKKKKERLTAVI